jgi:hypothetical protein
MQEIILLSPYQLEMLNDKWNLLIIIIKNIIIGVKY